MSLNHAETIMESLLRVASPEIQALPASCQVCRKTYTYAALSECACGTLLCGGCCCPCSPIPTVEELWQAASEVFSSVEHISVEAFTASGRGFLAIENDDGVLMTLKGQYSDVLTAPIIDDSFYKFFRGEAARTHTERQRQAAYSNKPRHYVAQTPSTSLQTSIYPFKVNGETYTLTVFSMPSLPDCAGRA